MIFILYIYIYIRPELQDVHNPILKPWGGQNCTTSVSTFFTFPNGSKGPLAAPPTIGPAWPQADHRGSLLPMDDWWVVVGEKPRPEKWWTPSNWDDYVSNSQCIHGKMPNSWQPNQQPAKDGFTQWYPIHSSPAWFTTPFRIGLMEDIPTVIKI